MHNQDETDACVVLVTCNDLPQAETIARAVVTEGLAACVNVLGGPASVRSFYMWEGALQEEQEVLLLIKTTRARIAALEARVLSLHGYTTPEFIVLPVMAGSSAYLAWMADVTASSQRE